MHVLSRAALGAMAAALMITSSAHAAAPSKADRAATTKLAKRIVNHSQGRPVVSGATHCALFTARGQQQIAQLTAAFYGTSGCADGWDASMKAIREVKPTSSSVKMGTVTRAGAAVKVTLTSSLRYEGGHTISEKVTITFRKAAGRWRADSMSSKSEMAGKADRLTPKTA